MTAAWNSKWEGQHGAQWDTSEQGGIWPTAPPCTEGTQHLPDPSALQPQAGAGLPSLGNPSLECEHSAQIPRAILSWVSPSPAHAPGMGQQLLQQGRKKLLALHLAPPGGAGTFPASCPCRDNPHSSSGAEGRRNVHLHPWGRLRGATPTHLEEPPGMGSVVRAQGEGPSCQGDQLGTSGGW